MIFDAAALRPTGKEVTLLPVALAYEQVAEQGSYLRELGGKNKRWVALTGEPFRRADASAPIESHR